MGDRACTPPCREHLVAHPTDQTSRCAVFGEVNGNIIAPQAKPSRVERRLGLDDDEEEELYSINEVDVNSASCSTPRGSWLRQSTQAPPPRPSTDNGRASINSVGHFFSDGIASASMSNRPSANFSTRSTGELGGCHGHPPALAPQTWQTPEVNRGATARLTGGNFGLPISSSLMYTPQIAPGLLAMRDSLDQELGPVNVANRMFALPAVTPLLAGRLYVGGLPDEETVRILRAEGIHNIVNCAARDYVTDLAVSAEFNVRDIDAFDSSDYLILHHDLDTFTGVVDDIIANRGEKVFVHCIAGINRSVSLCCAYLMEKMHIPPIETVRLFRANGRMRILENVSFRHQLVDHYMFVVTPMMSAAEEEGGRPSIAAQGFY